MAEKIRSSIALSSAEKFKIALIYVPILSATILGFVASAILGNVSLVFSGLATIAYVLGVRHGVDADHIVAIDNTTRKLMREGKRPLTVGTWFSLGHSLVVSGLTIVFVFFTRALIRYIPVFQSSGAVIGAAISGTFLWIIGLANVVFIVGIVRIIKELRQNKLHEESKFEELLNKRGLMNRYLSSLFKMVQSPKQIFPIGMLFGLGFDTATEIALIAVSVAVSLSSSIPVWTVLVLPFLFTCGMVLVDTTDGVAMRVVYGWAFVKPIRKIYYNLTMTTISVIVAFSVGTLEVLQVLAGELSLQGSIWSAISSLDFETIGMLIASIFVSSWLVSLALYKIKRIGA